MSVYKLVSNDIDSDKLKHILFLTQQGEAMLIYSGRNKLYRLNLDQTSIIIKHFARPNFIQNIYYSFFSKSKAERSHYYSLELKTRGVDVPESFGYIVERNRLGLIQNSFHICKDIRKGEPNIQAHARGWAAPKDFMPALAKYLAHCHCVGIEHLDLSPGNILYYYCPKEEKYHFYLIDLNRMKLYPRSLTSNQSIKNLCRLMNTPVVSKRLAYYYALYRSWDWKETQHKLEKATDKFWRKRWIKLSLRYTKKKYHCSLLHFIGIYLKYHYLLITNQKHKSEKLYQKYFQREDIRHIERKKRGFSYKYQSS